MGQKFEFNKYNTDLDKKLRRARGDSTGQKVARIAIIAVVIIILIIIVSIKISHKAEEAKQEIEQMNLY